MYTIRVAVATLGAIQVPLVLEPFGIRVESHFRRTSAERQQGDVPPEYHAVLLHQASTWLKAKEVIPDDSFVDIQAEWARRIAPHSQEKAEEIIAHLKSAADSIDYLLHQETPARRRTSGGRKAAATMGEEAGILDTDAGLVTCAFYQQKLTLIHIEDGTHELVRELAHPENQLDLPGFSP